MRSIIYCLSFVYYCAWSKCIPYYTQSCTYGHKYIPTQRSTHINTLRQHTKITTHTNTQITHTQITHTHVRTNACTLTHTHTHNHTHTHTHRDTMLICNTNILRQHFYFGPIVLVASVTCMLRTSFSTNIQPTCVNLRLRVDLDRHNTFIQSFIL